MNRRPLGLAVAGAGFVVAVIGLVGAALAGDEDDTPAASPASAGPVPSTTTTTASGGPTTVASTPAVATTSTAASLPATTTPTTAGPSSTSAASSPPTVAPTTAAPTTLAPSTTAGPAAEAPEAFVAAFGEAVRSGDAELLLARLHPEVVTRYGSEACAAYLEGIADPDFAGEMESAEPAPEWAWDTDGRSTPIADSILVRLIRRVGEPATEVHFAAVDGQLRWFTDCGDPVV